MSARRAVSSATAKAGAINLARLEKVRGRARDLRTHLTERGEVVENPERASVRRRDQVTFLDGEIVNGNDRQVATQRLPVGAVVERYPDPSLRSCVQEARALGVFAQNASELRRGDPVRDRCPRCAVVVGLIQVRLHVVELIPVCGDVRRARRESRRVDHRDARPLRQAGRRHVLPAFSAVARDVDQSVIRAGPDHSGGARRFGDREHGRIVLDGCLVFGDRAAGRAERARVVPGEIGTDRLECLAFVVRLKNHAAPDVHPSRVVRRDHDRVGPLKAILRVRGVVAHRVVRPWIEVPLKTGFDVLSGEETAVRSREHDVGRVGPHRDVAALAAADVVPVADVDSAALPAGAAQRRVVLLRAADAIREMVGRSHVVELPGRLVLLRPRFPAVERHVRAAVVRLDHSLRVVGRDPEVVVVAMRNLDRLECLAVVG